MEKTMTEMEMAEQVVWSWREFRGPLSKEEEAHLISKITSALEAWGDEKLEEAAQHLRKPDWVDGWGHARICEAFRKQIRSLKSKKGEA